MNGQTTTFAYDGDGNRVKKVQGGQTTVYLGAHYEKNVTTGVTTTYYYAGSTRVAMRVISSTGNVLYYLHGDHLGSTSLATSITGTVISRQRYTPYGSPRPDGSSTLPTDYRFTGQRSDAYINLYEMGARWYDSDLGRWISPDSIVPQLGNPQTLNRFTYGYNNPVKYQDPSGHDAIDVIAEFALGAVYQWAYSNRAAIPYPITPQQRQAIDALAIDSTAFQAGRVVGAVGATAQGIGEIAGGVSSIGGGAVACGTGVLCLAGAPAIAEGVVATGHGVLVTAQGVIDAAKQGTTLYAKTTGPGSWKTVNEGMSPEAAAYQAKITGRSGQAYVVNGVKFDGFRQGVLLEAKGYGYADFVENGRFQSWWTGQAGLLDQASRQIAAANGTPITWHVAEQAAANAMSTLLQENGFGVINVVYTP